MDGNEQPTTNYKGANKSKNPNLKDMGIKKKGSTFAWIEERDRRTGLVTKRERYNDPNIQTVHYRKRAVRWNDHPEHEKYNKWFIYYEIVRIDGRGTSVLGRITEYTTPERVDSFFYRLNNPDHLKPFSFRAPVRFSGRSESAIGKGATDTKTAYVTIPPEVVETYDIHVDDEIEITVTNADGFTHTGVYHVSKMNRNERSQRKDGESCLPSLIIPLTQFKRGAVVDFPEDPVTHDPPERRFIFLTASDYKTLFRRYEPGKDLTFKWVYLGKKYDSLNDDEKVVTCPIQFFIVPGAVVEISVQTHTRKNNAPSQVGTLGRFDFAFETLLQIDKEKRAYERKLQREAQRMEELERKKAEAIAKMSPEEYEEYLKFLAELEKDDDTDDE